MVQRFDLVLRQDALDRDAEILAPINKVNVGKRHVAKL